MKIICCSDQQAPKWEKYRNSAAYKEYYAIASGATPPKTKASVRKTHSSFDTTMSPPTASGTRLSTSTKGKQPTKSSKAKDLSVLSEVALTEAEQMKLATKISLQQTHISQASGSGADEGTEDDDEQDDDDQDDNNDDQDSNNDGDNFVYPKLTTHDEEAKYEESFDPIVQNNPAITNFGAPISMQDSNLRLRDKPHSFFAPEGKTPRRGLNSRPLACGNKLPKVTFGGHLS
nr:hypothetical protein [Tanacetum cinerariifolium]